MADAPNSTRYHVTYLPEEDRVLIALDLGIGPRHSMMLTRRLAKQWLQFLAGAVAKPQTEAKTPRAAPRQRVQEGVLHLEHTHHVAMARSTGEARREPRRDHADDNAGQAPRLVREIKCSTDKDGNIHIVLSDGSRSLTLPLSPHRVHVLIAVILDLAKRADWDFATPAAWLEDQGISFDKTAPIGVVH